MARVLLFACTSNTCRSPMAEAMAKKWFQEEMPEVPIQIGSIALSSEFEPPGSPASAFAVTAMARRGLDLTSHRSRLANADIVNEADAIVCVTARHERMLREMFPQLRARVLVFPTDIADPWHQDEPVYEACATQLWLGLKTLLPTLKL
ncbi:hypothetical protein AeMF1_000911 [Aphanomyces euteiches]|nr:hypothetical protein AeMF1_000911 [Aphanomyces euteiches]KAH9188912.1 hypothetical protein AeNC1_009108 [Aphanomyces euteiches]